jgi:Protein of unknown function DUF72
MERVAASAVIIWRNQAGRTMTPIYIGTAGWSVPSRYAAEIPQGGSHLERYARRLNAAEINSSFYRPHQRKTYDAGRGPHLRASVFQ